jgi:hypothetical protein
MTDSPTTSRARIGDSSLKKFNAPAPIGTPEVYQPIVWRPFARIDLG